MTAPSCMIFAAGFGTRMGRLTEATPKAMLLRNGRPLIDHAIALVHAAGVTRIAANTHHLHDRIAPHLASLGVTVFHETPSILDTGGGLRSARAHLSDPTLTLNPDIAFDGPNPLTHLIEHWREDMEALLLTVPLARARHRNAPGDFSLNDTRLSRGGDHIYTGAQMIRTETLDRYSDTAFSLNVVWDDMARRGTLHGIDYPGHWTEINTPEALEGLNGPADV